MTKTRQRKFQRWFSKGIPKGAPLNERYAFGAYKTNRNRRIVKRAGLKRQGKTERITTKNTKGWQSVYTVNKPLDILDDMGWRGRMVDIIEFFRKSKRGKVVFARLLLALSAEITYATVETEQSPDGLTLKWFGSREGHDKESVYSSFNELCDRILEGIGDSRDGMVETLSIFTLTSRRK